MLQKLFIWNGHSLLSRIQKGKKTQKTVPVSSASSQALDYIGSPSQVDQDTPETLFYYSCLL